MNSFMVPPERTEYHLEQGRPLTLGIQRQVTQEALIRCSNPAELLQYETRCLQEGIGRQLVDVIWRAGGTATVDLNFFSQDNHAQLTRELALRSRIIPAARLQQVVRLAVPHFEYFPADWVCLYCGWLNDGLKHPRGCPHCGGTKCLDWREWQT
jgi:rubrerythrin